MGVDRSWIEALNDIKNSDYIPLSDYGSEIAAVDGFVWLHQIIKQKSSTTCWYEHIKPSYVPPELQQIILHRYYILKKNFKDIIFVFNGARHEIKSVARINREKTILNAQEAVTKLEDKYRSTSSTTASPEDIKEYYKNLKKLTIPTNEMISHVITFLRKNEVTCYVAPFEAESQIRHLELKGEINVCISIDSDCVFLGMNEVIFEIDFENARCKSYKKENISKYDLGRYPEEQWAFVSSALGNDYVKRIKNISSKMMYKVLDKIKADASWTTAAFREIIQNAQKYKEEISLHRNSYEIPEDWEMNFQRSINFIKYSPIFDIEKLSIKPLNELPNNTQWESLIGFDPKSNVNVQEFEYMDAWRNKTKSWRFGDVKWYDPPRYKEGDSNDNTTVGKPLPVFAKIERAVTPISLLPNFVLQMCTMTVTSQQKRNVSRDKLVQHVSLIIADQESNHARKILAPSQIPKVYDPWILSKVYSSIEESDWGHEGYYEAIGDATKVPFNVATIFMNTYYPDGSVNVHNRAIQLITGGNINVLDLQWRKMYSHVTHGTATAAVSV